MYHVDYLSEIFSTDRVSVSRRALKNLALSMWALSGDAEALSAAEGQFEVADNMTDQFAALSVLVDADLGKQRASKAIASFYEQWKGERTVVDKWFALQVQNRHTTAASVTALMQHADFTMKNPNRARSVLFRFAMGNPGRFHADVQSYTIWADAVIALDSINAEVAARLARAVERWRDFAPEQRAGMLAQLERVHALGGLSANTSEIIGKALA
jgi:aminopeptidase N